MAETQLIREMKYATGMIDEDDLAANPITGLQLELRRTAWNILSLEQQLAEMTGQDLIWGRTFSEQKLALGTGPGADSYEMERDEAKINGHVQLYLKEREHYARICQLAINADLDTRIVNNATRHSETLYTAVMAGMQAAGLTSEQREAAMAAMSRELRSSPIELVQKGG